MSLLAKQKHHGQAEIWVSSEKAPRDRTWFYEPKKIDYTWQAGTADIEWPGTAQGTRIAVFPDQTYQEILGIGTSLEESTVRNLALMSCGKREEIYSLLLDSEAGAGFNLIRIALGSSDFTSRTFYTYNDLEEGETDFALERFSISKDIEFGIVGTLREMLQRSPGLKVFASSWTPPAWMKTSGSLCRGELKPGSEYIDVLARYYCKAVQAYMELGIPLYALTVQNEPLLEVGYPSCYMSPEVQKELITALRRELDACRLPTKIWIFDHNFSDAWSYACPILHDEAARMASDGIAFHDYEGEPSAMTELKAAFPEQGIYLTERSIWGAAAADRMVQYFRNWASSYNAWVTMLDSGISPHQWVGIPDPTLLVQNAGDRDVYWPTPELYLTGQFSKFIMRGARRIGSTWGHADQVTNVAFLNPDATLVVVAVNQTEEEQAFAVICEGKQIQAVLPPKSAATLRWPRGSCPVERA